MLVGFYWCSLGLDVFDRSVLSRLNAVLGTQRWSWRMPQWHARMRDPKVPDYGDHQQSQVLDSPEQALLYFALLTPAQAGSIAQVWVLKLSNTGCSGRNADALPGTRHVRVLPQDTATQLMVLSLHSWETGKCSNLSAKTQK